MTAEPTSVPCALDVHVYSRPGCMPCRRTKLLLDRAGVPYTAHDVEADPAAADRVRELGHTTVPVVTVQLPDGLGHWAGYRPEHVAALCYIAGGGGE